MKKLLFLFLTLLILGCTNNYVDVDKFDPPIEEIQSKQITINDYFGKEIKTYTHNIIDQNINCISGECPEAEKESVGLQEERDCYFCSSVKIKGDLYSFYVDIAGGSVNSLAGCTIRSDGPFIKGMDIKLKAPDKLLIEGDMTWKRSQISNLCDEAKDPECDDNIYGTCSTFDYELEYVETVQFEIKR